MTIAPTTNPITQRIERRNEGHIISIGGRPPGWAEHRSADRAAPRRRSSIDYQQRLARLEQRSRTVDLMGWGE